MMSVKFAIIEQGPKTGKDKGLNIKYVSPAVLVYGLINSFDILKSLIRSLTNVIK